MTYHGKMFVTGTLEDVKRLFFRKTDGGAVVVHYVPSGRFEIGINNASAFGGWDDPKLFLHSDAEGISYNYQGTLMCQVSVDVVAYRKLMPHLMRDLVKGLEVGIKLDMTDGNDVYQDKIDNLTGWKRTAAGTLGW